MVDDLAGVADDRAAGLDQGLRPGQPGVVEAAAQRGLDGRAVRRQRRRAALVVGREPAAEVEQPGPDPALGEGGEDPGRGRDRGRPGSGVALLRTDVEGDPGRGQAERVGRRVRISTACGAEQPYFRDSGQSDPSPEVTIRHSTSLPGAASATLRVSSGESTTNSRTPRAADSVMSSRRLTGLE